MAGDLWRNKIWFAEGSSLLMLYIVLERGRFQLSDAIT